MGTLGIDPNAILAKLLTVLDTPLQVLYCGGTSNNTSTCERVRTMPYVALHYTLPVTVYWILDFIAWGGIVLGGGDIQRTPSDTAVDGRFGV